MQTIYRPSRKTIRAKMHGLSGLFSFHSDISFHFNRCPESDNLIFVKYVARTLRTVASGLANADPTMRVSKSEAKFPATSSESK